MAWLEIKSEKHHLSIQIKEYLESNPISSIVDLDDPENAALRSTD